MKEDESNWFLKIVERYKYLISLVLIIIILGSSVFLLWRNNYFMPDIEKRVLSLEGKFDNIKQNIAVSTRAAPIEVEKLVVGSKEVTASSGGSSKVTEDNTSVSSQNRALGKQIAGKININIASQTELDSLPGIGPVYAKRIIDYRQSHGGFTAIDQIKEVKGIGSSIFNKIKDLIVI